MALFKTQTGQNKLLAPGTGFPRYLLLDLGLGVDLTTRAPVNDSSLYRSLLWTAGLSETNPELVREVQLEYLKAGADLLMTNSFRPNVPEYITELGIDEKTAEERLRNLVRDTRDVINTFWESLSTEDKSKRIKPLVCASFSQFGCSTRIGMDYFGKYVDTMSIESLQAHYRQKVRLMLEGGADILGFEGVAAAKEGEAICQLLEEFEGAKAWIAYVCKDGKHVGHGESIGTAAEVTLKSDAVVAVGVHCTDQKHVTSLLEDIPDEVKKRKTIVVYPNKGLEYSNTQKRWIGDSNVLTMDQHVSDWMDRGANWIGGCCHSTTDELSRMRIEMDKYLSVNNPLSS